MRRSRDAGMSFWAMAVALDSAAVSRNATDARRREFNKQPKDKLRQQQT
jgi:hypothetical protein